MVIKKTHFLIYLYNSMNIGILLSQSRIFI